MKHFLIFVLLVLPAVIFTIDNGNFFVFKYINSKYYRKIDDGCDCDYEFQSECRHIRGI